MKAERRHYEFARQLLTDPSCYSGDRGWAVNDRGELAHWDSPNTVRWCIGGALAKAAHSNSVDALLQPLARHLPQDGGDLRTTLHTWSIGHSHADALALLDRVIEEWW